MAFSGNISYGMQGDNVKKIQEALNKTGKYNLTIDGIWGNKTDAAVRDYQKSNGLTVDGIVGKNTWSSLFGSGESSTNSTPKFEYDPFEYDDYTESDAVKGLGDKKADAEDAVANYGDFQWSDQGKYDKLIQGYENREKFSYDFNTDALYQQYKDKYTQQGKMAMADTMGQAAAMTGGYGNSYAQTVGQQQYQASLDKLNDVIPELYQLAYEKYNQEGRDMLNMIGLLGDERAFAYGQWGDKYNQLVADRDYYGSQYASEREFDYGKYNADRGLAYDEHTTEQGYEYNTYRDSIEDAQWQANFDEAKRQFDESMDWEKQRYNNSISSSGGGSSGGSSSGGSSKGGSGSTSESTSGGTTTGTTSSVPSKIVSAVKNYTTQQGQADYLAGQVNAGNISQEQALQLLDEHGVVPLTERNWEMVDDGGVNWLWGVDNNAKVRDENGNEYTLKELKKELQKTMSNSKAKDYIKKLQDKLGI